MKRMRVRRWRKADGAEAAEWRRDEAMMRMMRMRMTRMKKRMKRRMKRRMIDAEVVV